jgi:hypothetical protein
MSQQHWTYDREQEILERLRKLQEEQEELEAGQSTEQAELKQILKDLQVLKPRLAFIKVFFGGNMSAGPVTLNIGQKTTASVVGFDQNGQPFNGPIPTPSYSIDDTSLDSIATSTDPSQEDVTSLAVGTANLTATVTGPSGPLTDTEQVINVSPQVLSSVKIQFSTPQ